MGSIGWDIVRTTPGAAVIRLSLTALVGRATAARERVPITRHGHALIATKCGLAVMVIAPIATVGAAARLLRELATDCAAATGRLMRRRAAV